MATAPLPPIRPESQSDFSGGANMFLHPALLQPDEAARFSNVYSRQGGGFEAREGFKLYAAAGAEQGTAIFEMEQSTGTILTFVQAGTNFYDETMQPRYRLFNQPAAVGDAIYMGSREKFNQLIFNILAAYLVTDWTFVWEVSNGAGGWIDITSTIVESVANAKKFGGAIGEWVFSWPEPATPWLPQQVDTFQYQYWLRARVSVVGSAPGSDVVHGQNRVRGDWVGRRHLLTADTAHLWERPGLTLTPRAIETWPTGQRIARLNAAFLNDYLYYASDGQRPLKRWNGSRGTTRIGGNNNPVNAGLVAPNNAPTEARAANAAAYPAGFVIRARIAFVFGPAGLLGEGPMSPTRQIAAAIAGGGEQITWDFTAARTQALTLEVHSIRLYATYDLTNTDIPQRDEPSRYLLIKEVLRDDTDWNNGTVVDTFLPRIQQSPIPYTQTPLFYPKGVVAGGSRLWIWDRTTVQWSDTNRGDSWNAENSLKFHDVKTCVYKDKRLYVFHGEDISVVDVPAVGIPDAQYFWRGLGAVQPDSVAIVNDEVHFISRLGPARIIQRRVELTGKGRVFEEGTFFWGEVAAERRLASGAGFEGRYFVGIDASGAGSTLRGMAVLDTLASQRGAWSDLIYKRASNQFFNWATLGVVHAPLDHELARKVILCGFGDAGWSADYGKLALLEYGTTDNWTTLPTDGVSIAGLVKTRAILMRAVDRFKTFIDFHVLAKFRRTAGGVNLSAGLLSNHGRTNSKSVTFTPPTTDIPSVDIAGLLTESAGGGSYRDTAPSLSIATTSDMGVQVQSWRVRARVERYQR